MPASGDHEWDVQLTKRQNVPATTAINTAATPVTTNTITVLLLLPFLLNQNILCVYRLLIRAYQQYFWNGYYTIISAKLLQLLLLLLQPHVLLLQPQPSLKLLFL